MKKPYIAPELTVHGSVKTITQQRPGGLPPGKVPCPQDANGGIGQGASCGGGGGAFS